MAAAPLVAGAATPVTRTGSPHMKLSLAAYSFNRVLPRRPDAEFLASGKAKMRLNDFVDFCAANDLDACEPTSYYFPADVTNEVLMNLKERTFRLGLDISGTAIGNDFALPEGEARQKELAMTREWIDHAAAMGAPVIRIFAGKTPKGDTEDAAIARCVEGINESLNYAATKGVYLALENHGGITATPEQMLRIVEAVKPSPWFGVNFDSGNFRTANPYGDLAKIAPYAVNAQIKVMMKPEGGKPEHADFARIVDILKDAGYRGYVVLEYEESQDPFKAIPPYLRELRGLIGG
jgi:sugar phosphate isomerase/epimerase